MRIVLNGQQPFGADVLRKLVDRGEDVVAVYCAPDRPNGGPDPLKVAAGELGVPVQQPESFKGPEAVEDMARWEADLMVMAFVTLFVPEAVLAVPTHGAIQYHPSLLPRHRGPSAINWAIIQGDATTGVTIFWPDDGLDTGPVLLREEVAIEPDDTLGSLYFDKLYPMGIEAMARSVDLVKAGDAPRLVQDESQATYEGWCRAEDVEIDWTAPAPRVYDLVRGANPRPVAWTTLDGEPLGILDCRLVDEDTGAPPGQVVEASGDGFVVAAAGGALRVAGVRLASGEKAAAGDLADGRLVPGTRLGATTG
jgi:methionyl-tRNA formyltransferase